MVRQAPKGLGTDSTAPTLDSAVWTQPGRKLEQRSFHVGYSLTYGTWKSHFKTLNKRSQIQESIIWCPKTPRSLCLLKYSVSTIIKPPKRLYFSPPCLWNQTMKGLPFPPLYLPPPPLFTPFSLALIFLEKINITGCKGIKTVVLPFPFLSMEKLTLFSVTF